MQEVPDQLRPFTIGRASEEILGVRNGLSSMGVGQPLDSLNDGRLGDVLPAAANGLTVTRRRMGYKPGRAGTEGDEMFFYLGVDVPRA